MTELNYTTDFIVYFLSPSPHGPETLMMEVSIDMHVPTQIQTTDLLKLADEIGPDFAQRALPATKMTTSFSTM